MEFFNELESMADIAANFDLDQTKTAETDDLQRWNILFGFSFSESQAHITQFRLDTDRLRITESHWELIREDKNLQGHDKESYEFYLQLQRTPKTSSSLPTSSSTNQTTADSETYYLIRLDGPLKSSGLIKEALSLSNIPETLSGTDEEGEESKFVKVTRSTKDRIVEIFKSPIFTPVVVPLTAPARKALGEYSLHPSLGIESTLPQFRQSELVRPSQDEYPVLYFFYGTLAEPDRLVRLLDLDSEPDLKTAFVIGGAMETWGGTYKGLVGVPGSISKVNGWAYLVKSAEDESKLRQYETRRYEVSRCEIYLENELEAQKGLTFTLIS
jgi:Gamma-glutamyl cyclotransferase, AIG2-like